MDNTGHRKNDFDLWIDIPNKEALEKDKGEINIFRKRILLSIFLLLIRNAGKGFDRSEVYQAAWGWDFDDFSTPGEVRKNISRLRSLIEPDRNNLKYIKLSSRKKANTTSTTNPPSAWWMNACS